MRVLMLLLSVGVLATACGGGSGSAGQGPDSKGGQGKAPAPSPTYTGKPPPLAPGYARVNGGAISVAHPPGWREGASSPKGWAVTTELARAGVTIARIGVITDVPQTRDADVVAATLFTGLQLVAKVEQRQPNRPLQIPGATGGVRVDYTYVDRQTGNLGRGADISIVYGNGKSAAVRVTGLRNRLSLEVVDRVVRSIVVQPPPPQKPS